MSVMRDKSEIAAVQLNAYKHNARRVYWQDTSGNIRESGTDNGSTWSATETTIVQALPDTPLAALAWGSNPQIRVFYIAINGILSERAYTNANRWVEGSLDSLQISMVPTGPFQSRLAACLIDDKTLRLYFAVNDAKAKKWWFQELVGDGLSWQFGATIDLDGARGIKQGSGYAAVGYKDRIYQVNEMRYDQNGPWKESGMSGGAVGGENSFAAIAYGSEPQIRRYNWQWWGPAFVEKDAQVICVETSSNGTGTRWRGPTFLLPAIGGTSLAAITWSDAQNQQQIKVYYQNAEYALAEISWVPELQSWSARIAVVPT